MKWLKFLLSLMPLTVVIYTVTYGFDFTIPNQMQQFSFLPLDVELKPRAEVKCEDPIFNFVFVKTHKTGSSSLCGLLRDVIETNQVNGARTRFYPRPFVGGYPGRFKCKFMIPKSASINLEHLRFDADELQKCFPSDTRYFTIIRRPWDSFQSAFHYYKKEFLQKDNCPGMPMSYVMRGRELNVHDFLLQASTMLKPSVPWYFRFRNYQSHDLGIDPMLDEETEINRKIQELDKNMGLVMLTEYLDESLILLKDLLCLQWDSLHQVYHYKEGAYNRDFDFPTSTHREAFEHLNKIDIALYKHFNKTLWRRVDAYGRERMFKDLQTLRDKRSKTQNIVEQREPNSPIPTISSQWRRQLKQYMSKNSGGCFIPKTST